jgi:hypothetical protein
LNFAYEFGHVFPPENVAGVVRAEMPTVNRMKNETEIVFKL